MKDFDVERFEGISREVRMSLINTSASCKIPHLGSCMSCIDILVYLYWEQMKCYPKQPENANRDRFILSKGHGAPALLQVLSFRGYFDKSLLNTFGVNGSYFHEHPPIPGLVPGIEAATGSLGHGLPMAIGMSIARKITGNAANTYVIVGDGECNEGSIWESAMIASAQGLSNLVVFVDYNKWQATDRIGSTVGRTQSMVEKWRAFGWFSQEINGHCFEQIADALDKAAGYSEGPSVIIAHTIKGKGVSFMEDNNNWHYKTPNQEELKSALLELEGDR